MSASHLEWRSRAQSVRLGEHGGPACACAKHAAQAIGSGQLGQATAGRVFHAFWGECTGPNALCEAAAAGRGRASTIVRARLECGAMRVLAFDTSSSVTAVAVTDGDRVLAHDDQPGEQRHAELLLPRLSAALAHAQLD